jgi:glycosyltransferase involved in cell wall biosynthesis
MMLLQSKPLFGSRQNLEVERAPIRICFMIDRLSRAGTETQLLALIRSLDRNQVSPSLVLLDGENDESRALEPDCPILRLGLRSLLRPATMSAALRLRQFWRRERVDILQAYFLDSAYFGVPLARLCGIKKVIRVRNNLGYWLTSGHRRLGRWMGRLAHVTLTNSASGTQALIESDLLSAEKIAVLENGVDLERFPYPVLPNLGSATVRVGLVGNLRPVKNVDGLIRVAAALRNTHPQLRFEVAGGGEQQPELERMIAEHNLNGIFRLAGAVSDVPGFLARQEIAVLCSHSEGMSNALLEYMASGRAIVATDVGANTRLVENGVHGLIVPPKNDEALAQAIRWLVDHPELAQKMAANARRRAELDWSRTAMVRRFEEFYWRLLHERPHQNELPS